jgi:16S rRNA (guanine(966)-N(2))-methyltransferase RsmD
MRIVAGAFKGRRLRAPAGRDVRPTSDRLRETLFNVLGPGIAGARVLDGYAGTGALGLEALSRGAAAVTFVERNPRALRLVEANVAICGAGAASRIVAGDFVRVTLPAHGFDLVLLDPPYDVSELAAVAARGAGLVARGGRLVLEHSRRRESPSAAGDLERLRMITAGDSALSFYGS